MSCLNVYMSAHILRLEEHSANIHTHTRMFEGAHIHTHTRMFQSAHMHTHTRMFLSTATIRNCVIAGNKGEQMLAASGGRILRQE
jgi:hypothetical protein